MARSSTAISTDERPPPDCEPAAASAGLCAATRGPNAGGNLLPSRQVATSRTQLGAPGLPSGRWPLGRRRRVARFRAADALGGDERGRLAARSRTVAGQRFWQAGTAQAALQRRATPGGLLGLGDVTERGHAHPHVQHRGGSRSTVEVLGWPPSAPAREAGRRGRFLKVIVAPKDHPPVCRPLVGSDSDVRPGIVAWDASDQRLTADLATLRS
jgi:hypothetical protein